MKMLRPAGLVLSCLMLCTPALAGSVVLTPMISNGADSRTIEALEGMMSSQLQLLPGIDRVENASPKALNTACLDNNGCMKKIVSRNRADSMLTGVLTKASGPLVLDMVYFQNGQPTRRKTYQLNGGSAELVYAVPSILGEMVFGQPARMPQAPAAQAYAPPVPAYAPPAPAYAPPVPAYAPPVAPVAPAPSAYVPTTYAPPSPYAAAVDPYEERELAELDAPLLDLDAEPDKPKKTKKAKASARSTSTATLDRATPKTLQLAVRGGFSKFHHFNFVTMGLEVGVPVTDAIVVIGGIESYNVQRLLPTEFQVVGQSIYTWNTIYPANLGGLYKLHVNDMVIPYVGADVIFAQYYKDELGTDWSAGMRARGGVDLMLHKNVGINANVAMGGWFGKNWRFVDPDLSNGGFLPEISGGAVFAF